MMGGSIITGGFSTDGSMSFHVSLLVFLPFPFSLYFHSLTRRPSRTMKKLTAPSIPPFLYRTLRPPVLEVDPYAYEPLTKIDNVIIIGHIHPQDYELYDLFYDLANKYREEYGFVLVPPEEGATGSLVRCWNHVEGTKWVTSARDLDGFVRWCGGPVGGDGEGKEVSEFAPEREGKTDNKQSKVVRFSTESEREKDEFRREVTGLARRLSGQVKFVVVEGARGLVVEGGGENKMLRVEGAPRREFVEELLGVTEGLWTEEDEKDGFRVWRDEVQLAALAAARQEANKVEKDDGLWKDGENRVHEEL